LLADSAGQPYLLVLGVDGEASTVLRPNQPVRAASGYSYTFTRRVEASGIDVRRDPGDTFIWIAVGMAVVGLSITFYVPRRRLWVKVTPERTWMAGQGERTRRLSRELRHLGAAAGSQDALLPEDVEER
jgi:cytochrome c biogenesis protein